MDGFCLFQNTFTPRFFSLFGRSPLKTLTIIFVQICTFFCCPLSFYALQFYLFCVVEFCMQFFRDEFFFSQCVCHFHWQTATTYKCAPAWFHVWKKCAHKRFRTYGIHFGGVFFSFFLLHRRAYAQKNRCPAFACKHRQETENGWLCTDFRWNRRNAKT